MKKIAKAILYKGDQVLLQLRSNNPKISYPNMWSLFGGEIEDKETAEDCLIREIGEEIHCEIRDIHLVTKRIRSEAREKVLEYIFTARISDVSKMKLSEGSAMMFFHPAEIPNINLTPHYRKDIDDFVKHME